MSRIAVRASTRRDCCTCLEYMGKAIAARIATIANATMSSIRLKPDHGPVTQEKFLTFMGRYLSMFQRRSTQVRRVLLGLGMLYGNAVPGVVEVLPLLLPLLPVPVPPLLLPGALVCITR